MTYNLEFLDAVSEECEFDPRRLRVRIPSKSLRLASYHTNAFLGAIGRNGFFSSEDLINGRWRQDEAAQSLYKSADRYDKLEMHTIIGAVIHELNHKVDYLISPFGIQYLALLIEEYQALQTFIPHALDVKDRFSALPIWRSVIGETEASIAQNEYLNNRWSVIQPILRKFMAWGDLGGRFPPKKFIEIGWDGEHQKPADYFGIGEEVELVKVFESVYSFRPKGNQNWYLRPRTLFETRALSNVILYIIDIDKRDPKGSAHDYYQQIYGRRKRELSEDYFYVLDLAAKFHQFISFEDVIVNGKLDMIRSVLLFASCFCWFALQAAPQESDEGMNFIPGNSVMRLFSGLVCFSKLRQDFGSRGEPWPYDRMATIFSEIEEMDEFALFEQSKAEDIVSWCNLVFQRADAMLESGIWHPDVKAWFKTKFDIARPHFANRTSEYSSLLGMPENGNQRYGVRSDADLELFYLDHVPGEGAEEWLTIRENLLMGDLRWADENDQFMSTVARHFEANYVPELSCPFCGQMHHHWVSRFSNSVTLYCPITHRSRIVPPSQLNVIDVGM